MKKNLHFVFFILISLPFTLTAQSQFGIGFKLGDPLGISAKKYGDDFQLEMNFGRTYYYWRHYNYPHLFHDKYKYKDEWYYEGHSVRPPLSVQIHFLKSNDIKGAEGLQVYYGFGPQVRFAAIRYSYRYKVDMPPYGWYWEYDSATAVQLDIGIDGVVGLEYTFQDAPVSIFADVNLFLEFYDNFFEPWIQGGIGARYNF